MILKGLQGIIIAVCVIACASLALAITCDECKTIDKKRTSLEQEIARKEAAIQVAFDKKKFHEVTEIRRQVVDLRRNLIDLQKQDLGCKDACRADVVKGAECSSLRAQIMKMEEDAASPTEKIDALYRDLATCNKDLAELKAR